MTILETILVISLIAVVNARTAGDPNLLSFKYEEGQPSAQPYTARPLAGQDGWEDRGGASVQPVVTNHLSETGKQVIYREVAGGRSSLRRRMTVENGGGQIRISASYYYTPKELPNESGWPHTVFLTPCGDDGGRILEFGIDKMNGPPRLYAFVPLEGVPDHLLTVANPQPLQEGWYWVEVLLDQGNRKILSVRAARVEPGLAPAQSRKVLPILSEPLPYGRDSKSKSGDVHYLNLAMGDNSALDDIHFGNQTINFEMPAYSAQASAIEGPLRSHRVRLAQAKGTVYVYATFGMVEANLLDQLKGLQTITLGEAKGETFTPVVRFGLANDKGRAGSRVFIVPWLNNGKMDYYGGYCRPRTPCSFRLKVSLLRKRLTAWVSQPGDDDWFQIAENVPLVSEAQHIDEVRVEQYPGAQPITDCLVQNRPWPPGERVRPSPLSKKNRVVKPGVDSAGQHPHAGFRFQSMRSVWQQPGRQVTIERNPPRWYGFPDVVQTGPRSLACCYNDGAGHGGGGGLFVRHSDDLGHTWGDPITVHPSGLNAPRIQKLHDGTLLVLGDIHGGSYSVVMYDSCDGGKTWTNQRWLDPVKAGGTLSVVPSRVLEMPDGSWMLSASSWYPLRGPEWESEWLEFYTSGDRGKTWKLLSTLKSYPARSLSEPTTLLMPDGSLWMIARESRYDTYPGAKAYSRDGGKTWEVHELPFCITGRTCAGYLQDGRVMVTFRSGIGRAALWAWIGDAEDPTGFQPAGVHFNDKTSVALGDGALHIDSDGACGQFTQYCLRPPDSPGSAIELIAEVKVVANQGHAATLAIPFVGKIRLFPDRAEFAHDPSLQVRVTPGEFHTYRITYRAGKAQVYVDGKLSLETDRLDPRLQRGSNLFSIMEISGHNCAFGNESLVASSTINVFAQDIPPSVTGYSIWKRVEERLDDPRYGQYKIQWSAKDGFPDQYQLDHIIEVQASVQSRDQGYSGWTQLPDGRVYVVQYTDDTAPVNPPSGVGMLGVSWIRGTYLLPSDLPVRESNTIQRKGNPSRSPHIDR